jgi:hypothetical protein
MWESGVTSSLVLNHWWSVPKTSYFLPGGKMPLLLIEDEEDLCRD